MAMMMKAAPAGAAPSAMRAAGPDTTALLEVVVSLLLVVFFTAFLAALPFLAGASSLAKKLNWLAMAAWLLRIAGCCEARRPAAGAKTKPSHATRAVSSTASRCIAK